jgi:hypothetical protein
MYSRNRSGSSTVPCGTPDRTVTGKVPVDWLIGNVIPIFKKGDNTDPANYRLVSLTSVPCKIMEHIIFSAVMKHFDNNKILSYQYGFSKNHSCEHQLINTTEDLAKIRDQKGQADVLILDFSKALDTVPYGFHIFSSC